MLVRKLSDLKAKFDKLQKNERSIRTKAYQVRDIRDIKRWKYILIKQVLDESIDELVTWQKSFDPSWFLMLKISSPSIDRELSKNRLADSSLPPAYSFRDALRGNALEKVSVFLPRDGLENAEIRNIAFASAKCMQRTGSNKFYIVDSISCNAETNIDLVENDVRELARKLSSVEPLTFGILQCRGVVRIMESSTRRPSSFDMVFQIPKELSNEPKSLRGYLSLNFEHTLTNRVQLAKQLAKSVSYVHTLGFVHKNIRPETVLGFQSSESEFDLFFLVGFEKIRLADGQTWKSGDSDWEKNLYRHPHRQGLSPEEAYNMQHDIYSLGVCLLEIGLWESFLSYKQGATAPVPAAALGITWESPEFRRPALMKEHLIALAKRDLAKRMGERYEKVVVNCLTCLDEVNPDFGDPSEFEDPDGVLIGVKYIDKVFIIETRNCEGGSRLQ